MRVSKVILLVLAAIVVLCGAVFIAAGLLLPAERSFANEVEINAPADIVWQVINDRDKYTEWQPNLTRVEVIDERKWVEYPKNSPESLRFETAKDERPIGMEFKYTMGDSFAGRWRGEIGQTASGVKLKTEDSYSAEGWLTKILVAAFFDMDSFAKDWNQRLKRRAESLDQ
jgi:uncharacterized membrane protein